MTKKKQTEAVAAQSPIMAEPNPLLTRTPIAIQGKLYELCFDMRRLFESERDLRLKGYDVNLLRGLGSLHGDAVASLFPIALHVHHPEVTYDQAVAMIADPWVLPLAANAVYDAFYAAAATPKRDEANPTKPALK